MWPHILNFGSDEEGATAIEYSLIAALVAVVIIASLLYVGEAMIGMYTFLTVTVTDATG